MSCIKSIAPRCPIPSWFFRRPSDSAALILSFCCGLNLQTRADITVVAVSRDERTRLGIQFWNWSSSDVENPFRYGFANDLRLAPGLKHYFKFELMKTHAKKHRLAQELSTNLICYFSARDSCNRFRHTGSLDDILTRTRFLSWMFLGISS